MTISRSSSSSTENKKSENEDIFKRLDADKLVDAYGKYGRYQLFAYFLCQILNFPYSASMYIMNYVQMNPDMNCTNTSDNTTLSVDESCWIQGEGFDKQQCGSTNETTLQIYDSTPVRSLINDFGLTCGSFVWKEAGLTIFTVGALVTVPFMANLADKYGRRPLLLASITISLFANIATAFAPNFWSFLILRFIVGASSDTYFSISAIATCEFVSNKFRAWITLIYTVAWSCGMFWVGILTLFISDWRHIYLAHAAPFILCLSYYFILPESPHWLIYKQKTDEIKGYIETSNKWNGREVNLAHCLKLGSEVEPTPQTIKEVCRSRTVLRYLVINGFIQFSMSLVYFAISYISTDLSSDKFTAFMLSALVEIPGGLIVIPLMLYFGRKWITFGSLMGQGILLIIAPFTEGFTWWFFTAVLLFVKFVNSVTYGIHPIYASEMMPTSVRSLCFSIINVPQSLGIIAASYFKHMVNFGPDWVRFVVVGGLMCISSALVIMLPETKDQAMPPDIQSLGGSDACSVVSDTERDRLLSITDDVSGSKSSLKED